MTAESQVDGREQLALPRYPLIAFIGPMGCGKSVLSTLLGQNWDVPDYKIVRIEEAFVDNPYLQKFYDNPGGGLSLSTQLFFLKSKAQQLKEIGGICRDTAVVVDPGIEMDRIFATAHYVMGWMSTEELGEYIETYESLRRTNEIPEPDIFAVVNANPDVIRQRIQGRGRVFELSLLKRFPDYFDVLHILVDDYYRELQKSGRTVFRVDSGKMDFVNTPDGRLAGVREIGDRTSYYMRRRGKLGADGAKLIFPSFV